MIVGLIAIGISLVGALAIVGWRANQVRQAGWVARNVTSGVTPRPGALYRVAVRRVSDALAGEVIVRVFQVTGTAITGQIQSGAMAGPEELAGLPFTFDSQSIIGEA
jgi:hypothetical protein